MSKQHIVPVVRLSLALLGWSCVAVTAAAEATSLDQLLGQVKASQQAESKENASRELEFRTNLDKQAAMLKAAEQEQAAAEAESNALSSEFDKNEVAITQQTALLREREGNLGELFGVVRQVAGDTATNIEQSMISAQYPGRADFLRGLASAKKLPSIDELERLWVEMQTEMTQSAKVIRYNGTVVKTDGKSAPAKITRVGPFAATSDGEFLVYQPSLQSLAVLPKQGMLSSFKHAALGVEDATTGYVEGVADPGRGLLFQQYSERPTFLERIQLGQFVGYIIIGVGVVGACLWVYQLIYLVMVRMRVRAQLKNLDHPTPDNPLGRVMLAFKGDTARIEEDYEIAELRIAEASAREIPLLERFQAYLRLAVAAGPLLGLIGTVIGMIITFQAITESGSGDPKIMAQGIGQAMIATVLGLGIAIPLLFANAVLASLSRGLVQMLDEQSNGMLAESIERQRRV